MNNEIDAIRALLTSKSRPVGWAERRARIDEVGAVWPVASDIVLETADGGGMSGEFSLAPGSDAHRVLMFPRHVTQSRGCAGDSGIVAKLTRIDSRMLNCGKAESY